MTRDDLRDRLNSIIDISLIPRKVDVDANSASLKIDVIPGAVSGQIFPGNKILKEILFRQQGPAIFFRNYRFVIYRVSLKSQGLYCSR